MIVTGVEGTACQGRGDRFAGDLKMAGGDVVLEVLRDPHPFAVGENGSLGGTVEVLGRPAALLGADQLDAVVFQQHPHVVGDFVDVDPQLQADFVRRRDPGVEDVQRAEAEWMT